MDKALATNLVFLKTCKKPVGERRLNICVISLVYYLLIKGFASRKTSCAAKSATSTTVDNCCGYSKGPLVFVDSDQSLIEQLFALCYRIFG